MSGSVQYRKDTDCYYIQWPVRGQRPKKIYRHNGEKLTSQRRALKLLAMMQGDVERGVFRIEKYTQEGWTDVISFIEEWYAAVEGDLKPATRKGYKSYKENHLIPFFRKNLYELHEIDLMVLTKLLHSLKPVRPKRKLAKDEKKIWDKKQLSGKQKFNIMSSFHACLDFAWRCGRIVAVPPFPKKTAYNIQTPLIEWLPSDRQMAVLEFIPDEHKPIFYFLKYHMRRPAEAMALYRQDYIEGYNKYTPDHFIIRRSISARVVVESTKTNQIHEIPCHDDFKPYLQQALNSPIISPFLFTCKTSRSEGKRYSSSVLNRLWKIACRKAGEDIDLYSGLKHSTVTQYAVEEGYSDSELQALTDHARIDSVANYRKKVVVAKKNLMMKKKVVSLDEKRSQKNNGVNSG